MCLFHLLTSVVSASVWVARQPPGFAFIEFEDRRDGEDAINEMNNKELFGCLLRVEESKGRRGKGGKGGDDGMKPGDWYLYEEAYTKS